MGKPKLKSSIKSLFSFKPPAGPGGTMTWVCTQESKAHYSFTDVYKSFNSMYYSSSTPSSSLNYEEEEEATSSSLSSESTTIDESVPRGAISSKRFFFSPCSTKSIMEEAVSPSSSLAYETEEKGEEGEAETKNTQVLAGFCRNSLKMAMASEDPYMDFRLSMEEMVEAHGLRDWSRLQELLHCYLSINEKKTHKVIILAFVDLLMTLISEEEQTSVDNSSPSLICSTL